MEDLNLMGLGNKSTIKLYLHGENFFLQNYE